MTAPDPTAGERECRYPCGCGQFPDEHCACMDGHAPPAVAASTGTSEDAEALAELIWHNTDEPMWSAMVLAKQFLASDWLAAQLVAAEQRGRDEARGVK